ncbi:unnamed protein product [Cuscuta campestris]|uniref:Chromo domain-containing protein n=1 Tax=Cuscuta campestris TaxID=132261 RepID=A0A484MV11_9ASTE|nr:unnamed protein product [Cuscuta campestris]
MVHETRSRSKMGADDVSSKNQVADREETSPCSRKADCLSLRSLARETSSKDTRTSPSPTRKSERIQKKSSPVTPVVCNKLDKLDTPSPLRRSVRGKRNVPSSPKIPEDESVSSGMESHGKKKETMKQPMMESEKVSTSRKVHYKSLSSIGKKRKRINGHSYALLLKRRHRRGTLSGITKSKRILQLPEVDSSDSRNEESKLAEDEENGDNECHTKITNELTNHLAPHFDDGASKDELEACPGIVTLKIPNLICSGLASGEHEIIRSSKTHMVNTDLEVTVADANMHTCTSAPASEPLSGDEKHFFAGFCVSCSKQRRVGHDSPKVELCSCVTMHNKDNNYISSPEVGVGVKDILFSGYAEKCHSRKSEGDISDPYVDKNENVCIVCKESGKSILCNGNGCKRCYHLPSSGPSINDVLLGIWHCLWCQMKKIAFGVHSVTKGVDSICDAREVDVSGTHMQKQYLVKYIDLAHVHNHWVSEAQLLLEAPFLVANFSDNNQVIGWNSEWTLPHRLLKKRSLSFSELLGDGQNFDAGHNTECQFEWFVKWRGLDYENATWELEIADCLRSPHGQTLVREYELRLEKAKQLTGKNNKQSLVGLPKIWDGSSLISDMDMLNSMNKLHDHWSRSENVALYEDQEKMMKIGLFILSMSKVCCWPVLIVTASHAISHWEAELKKWAPAVDCVAYQGSRETRRIIEMCEFYSQGGSIILQVLLTSFETALEDIHTLNRLNWELVVFDQCQHLNLSPHVEKVETLGGLKVLLFNGPVKHTASESSNILSLVYSDGDLGKADLLKTCSNNTLGQWKEKAASQEFFEYWLPVQLSGLQLELYCDTLLSNIDALCSYSKSDPVGALNNMLLNIRKCCDHPYIICDPSTNLLNKELSQANILDIGIQASGKLQLLDKMLSEMKCRQLRTIILFQDMLGWME